MKKLALTIFLSSIPYLVYSLPIGNPSEPNLICDGLFIEGPCYDFCEEGVGWCDAHSLRLGYYGDFVFNRLLEIDDNESSKNIDHSSLFTNAAYGVVNFWDRLEAFATIGATNFLISSNAILFGPPSTNGNRLTIESDSDFSWSFGFRFTFGKSKCSTRFGVEGQYFYTESHIKRISVQDLESIYPENFAKIKYQEWQIGIGISQRLRYLIPYFGLKLSGVKVDLGNAMFAMGGNLIQLQDLKNQFESGYVIGISFLNNEYALITVEGRFRDEKAAYLNGQFRF